MDTSAVMKTMLDSAMKAHPEAFANFDRTKNVQDQLQEMVSSDWKKARDIFNAYAKDYGFTHCTSMEQFCLAVVMRDKYGKRWTDGEWFFVGVIFLMRQRL